MSFGFPPTRSRRSGSTILTPPVGRPPNEVRRSHANFTYQAGTWTKPCRVVAKVERHPGELYPRVPSDILSPTWLAPPRTSSPFTTNAAPASNGSRKVRARSDGLGCHAAHSPPTPSAFTFTRCQRPRRLPAHIGDAGDVQRLVADEPEGKADQDRRKSREPRPLRRLSVGRRRDSENSLRRHIAADRGTAAAAGLVNSVRRSIVTRSNKNHRRSAS